MKKPFAIENFGGFATFLLVRKESIHFLQTGTERGNSISRFESEQSVFFDVEKARGDSKRSEKRGSSGKR